MLDALAEHLPPEADWTRPAGGLFIWATLPDYIDTTDLLARALREHVAFVPGRAAYLDGRGGSAMRLNFSGVGEDDMREGVRADRQGRQRAGAACTRRSPAPSRPPRGARPPSARGRPATRRRPTGRADRAAAAAGRRRAMSRVAVLEGGQSLERQVSLRSGARVRDALERLGHEVIAIDVGPDLVERLTTTRPDVAFVALHGRDGEDGTVQEILELVGVPYTASGPSACMRCMDKVLAKHALRDAGLPTPDFYAFSQTAFESLGAAHALPAIEERLDFPVVVKPAAQGSALGIRFAPTRRATCPPRSSPRSPTTRRCCSSATSPAASSRSRCSTEPRRPEALPVVEAIPRGGDRYDFEARYEIGRTEFVCPAELDEETTPRAQAARARRLPRPRLLRLRPRRPDARRATRRAHGARGERDPGADGDVAAAAGRRGGGHLLRRASSSACSTSRSRARRR